MSSRGRRFVAVVLLVLAFAGGGCTRKEVQWWCRIDLSLEVCLVEDFPYTG